MTIIQASKKANEKEIYSNLKDERAVRKPKFNLGQLVRTGDSKKVLVRVIQENGFIIYIQSQKLYMILYHHIKSIVYPKDILNTCKTTKLTLEELNKVMKLLNLIQ